MPCDSLPAPVHALLIVDDHPVVRMGLAQLLADEPGLEVVGEAGEPSAALAALRAQRTDLVLLDLSLKTGTGIDLLRQIRGEFPQTRVLVVSVHDEGVFGERAIRAGANGYVMKDAPYPDLLAAVRKAAKGELAVSDALAAILRASAVQGARQGLASPLAGLSDRELEVFDLIGRGLDTRNIAAALKISVKTVETHQQNLKHKLGATSAHHLRRLAFLWSSEPGGMPDPAS
jgi:DNA-binding NarL/FixJ family response regulator